MADTVTLSHAIDELTLDAQLLAAETWTFRTEDNRVVLNPTTEFNDGAVLSAIYL